VHACATTWWRREHWRSRCGRGSLCVEFDGNELGEMRARGMEDFEAWVGAYSKFLFDISCRINFFSGELHIAEVASRFTSIDKFVELITSIGFRLKAKVRASAIFFLIVDTMPCSRIPQIRISRFSNLTRQGGRLIRRRRWSGVRWSSGEIC